jgi:hypothetical protein
MAKLDQIADPELRAAAQGAHAALRGGDPAGAVRICAATYERYLRAHPSLLAFVKQGRRLSPSNWPRLGTRLTLEPGRVPEITVERDRFAFSEAATIYEFTVDSIVAGQAFVTGAPDTAE